jgi:hypothetical protein
LWICRSRFGMGVALKRVFFVGLAGASIFIFSMVLFLAVRRDYSALCEQSLKSSGNPFAETRKSPPPNFKVAYFGDQSLKPAAKVRVHCRPPPFLLFFPFQSKMTTKHSSSSSCFPKNRKS